MDWIGQHLSLLITIFLTLTGVGAQARWAALSRSVRWLIAVGKCEERRVQWEAAEKLRIGVMLTVQEDVRLLQATVISTQAQVRDLLVQRDADRARIRELETLCGDSSPGGGAVTATPTTPSSGLGPISSAN